MRDVSPSIAPSHRFQFGMNSMNNLLSQMPKKPVLNIRCQTRADIKNAIQMLGQWVLYKIQHDSILTRQILGTQLVAGLSRLAYEWWRWLPQEAGNEILSANDADQQMLHGLSKELYGPNYKEDYDHLASIFMSARLCDLSKSEEYFCYMQNLLVSSSKSTKQHT